MSASTNWEDAYRTQTERVEELRRENAALRNEVARLNNQTMWVCSCGGTDCAGQKENAALRVALNEFSNLSYVALLAPVPNARPHYALVKKHEALLNNGLKKEAQP